MALSAKRLVSKTQKTSIPAVTPPTPVIIPPSGSPTQSLPTSPEDSGMSTQADIGPQITADLKGQTIAQQDAAKSEIDSLLKDLLQAEENGESPISLSDTLIPQAAMAEVESGAIGNISSDPLGGFILPEKQDNQAEEPSQDNILNSDSLSLEPEQPASQPVTISENAEKSDNKPDAINQDGKNSEQSKDKTENTNQGKPSNGDAKTEEPPVKTKKHSSLPAAIGLIILIILAGYVAYTYIVPLFSESSPNVPSSSKQPAVAKKITPATAVSNTVEVINAVKARNSTGSSSETKQIPQGTQVDIANTSSEQVQPKAAKKKHKTEEIVDIPFDDDELPEEYRPRPWPELSLTAVIAKGKKGDGFATVNGETLSVGDETSSGVQLISVAVNPPRAIFKFDGREQTVLVSNKGE